MKRLVLILASSIVLLLSACGTSKLPSTPPVENLEIAVPEIEVLGCSLPALQEDDLENFDMGDCVFLGCIRYIAR
jgi:hypothetical protein